MYLTSLEFEKKTSWKEAPQKQAFQTIFISGISQSTQILDRFKETLIEKNLVLEVDTASGDIKEMVEFKLRLKVDFQKKGLPEK
jgi:hypothetical protein